MGTVKSIRAAGYGFITGVDGLDRFFHVTDLVGTKIHELAIGDVVSFDADDDAPKGPRAAIVQRRERKTV
jgi:cold shock CspA family protein